MNRVRFQWEGTPTTRKEGQRQQGPLHFQPSCLSPISGGIICLLLALSSLQAQIHQPTAEPLPLSLKQAIDMALAPDGNARMQIATELVKQAKARSAQARGALLPNLEGYVTQQDQTRNLAAAGIKLKVPIPGFTFPEMVGPFGTFDARATATQNIFDLSSIRRYQAARANFAASGQEKENTEDQVISAVAKGYLMAQRAKESVNACTANKLLAESLLKLAQDRKEAGTGTGIEVTRAQVQLANEQQRLLLAESEYRSAQLQLLKLIGLKLNTALEMTDPLSLPAAAPDPASPEAAIEKALSSRADYKAQMEKEESARLSYSSVKWERLPSVVGFGDYGAIGNSTDHLLPTRTIGISLRVPIFDGGRRDARRAESAAACRQEQIKTKDLRDQVELEVRLAMDRLLSAQQQTVVAAQGLNLSENEMAQAERRYRAGVTSSLELTDAQTRLERARDNHILALYLYQSARIDLNQAIGTIKSWVQ
jgi:outer membrane protein